MVSAPPATDAADVCVIGSGLAGLTVARRLVDAGLTVAIVEGGQWERDGAAQDLAEGDLDSRYYSATAIAGGRRRQFGGTANDWTHVTKPGTGRDYARTLPGERIDFEQKEWAPSSGWPLTLDDLLPFYRAAQQLWIGKPLDNDVAAWAAPERPLLPVRPGPLTARLAQYGPNDVFTKRIRDELLQSGQVQLHLGATVVQLGTGGDARGVRRARAERLDGSELTVHARAFVLAGGGVENVQTLLGTEHGATGGAWNRHDVVGRYITDHPEYRMARIVPADRSLLDRLRLYDIFHDRGEMVGAVLTLDQATKRRERLLNVGAVLIPQPAAFGTPAERALRAIQAGEWSKVPAAVRTVLQSPAEAAAVLRMRAGKASGAFDYPGGHVWHRGGWSRDGFDRSCFGVLEVHVATEQSPDPANRITLSGRRDALGRRRVTARLHWSVEDRRNLERTMRLFRQEIEESGIGRFEPWVEYAGSRRPVQDGWHHPMGGTRMHDDSASGVVDRDCRVHGTDNLFVAGSSTFTTGLGYSNPTLTIVALGLRLGGHLGALLGTGAVQRPAESSTAEAVPAG